MEQNYREKANKEKEKVKEEVMNNKWGKGNNKEVIECKKDRKYRKRINNGKEIGLECSAIAQ